MYENRGKSYARQVWETVIVTLGLSLIIGIIGYVNSGCAR